MLVLFETPAGYAIFKLLDEKKLKKTENLYLDFQTPEQASNVVQLKHFKKFDDMTEALSAATASVEGKMSKHLKKIMKKLVSSEAQETLAVADAKLGNAIKSKYNLDCLSNSAVHELMRGIRSQMDSLITGLPQKEMSAMALGLAHSLSRYKLKFSPDKVDTMIVQAIALLDDLDKELNNYIMRAREWYGWHFPEITKIVTDNLAFAKVVKLIGDRTNASLTDMSSVLPEEMEQLVKEAAEISMGTEVSAEDIRNILSLCDEIVEITQYRAQLFDYLKNRMMAIAPNLTLMVGELVGARLIAHAGSLINLAKHPSSTVQILGAEKALFRALKTKHDTPKYGLIYHASLVGQSSQAFKGKMSRKVAAKTSLAARVDALGEDTNIELGMNQRAKLEMALKRLEDGQTGRISGLGKQQAKFDKYQNKSQVKLYDTTKDSTLPVLPQKRKRDDAQLDDTPDVKLKKSKIEVLEPGDASDGPASKKIKVEKSDTTFDTSHSSTGEGDTSLSKKKKKKIKTEEEDEEPAGDSTFNTTHDATLDTTHDSDDASSKKKKKKKKHQKADDSSVSLDASVSSSHDVTQDSSVDAPPSEKKKKKKKHTD